MTKEYWLEAALTNDTLVAEFLLRLKQSSSSDSLHAPPPPPSSITSLLPPPGWGHRKNRSKSTPSTTIVIAKDQRGSPTTHLSWSGASTSDGYEESSRPSDLSSGGRSIKANEGASTSGYNKSLKRKSFAELKEEEGSLLKERMHINKELASMRSNLHQQMATSENLKRIKINYDENPRNVHEPAPVLANQSVQIPCRVEAESKALEKGFVLPDLNMMPNEDDVTMVS
ncbi:uncharacterized protein LOC112521643 [Cynara cardunculus var. scolymus]|uniref:Uncharacterized protein n=1 Tax=Cynara cardunculus var. scolymus TaxID=59895 RepID=A0A118JTV1_CYNCS|nr:uncharacterized protein LOC112521643 [Cynara cardunculus var. scolymus]KVH90267.1 hypothetical protein Ccrd_007742 [Cynara cardunculus var. scolymus]